MVYVTFVLIMQLVIASNNKGKILEIKEMISGVALLSLADIGFIEEIPEPYYTFEENAYAKAGTVHKYCGKNVFADDSGLCVNHLNGAPGVDSAHFSGTRDDEKNLQLVLKCLQGARDRSAYYKAVMCLVWNGEVHYFEGICEGMITDGKRGAGGFGYDPIFVPNGYDQTFAELPIAVKNEISHRAKAVKKMVQFIVGKMEQVKE